ncbi:hypothetical protein CTAYLR_001585 [Chrysophaeum taylorii]|uniref:Methyltransferase type 12 domain-containing protein n=1 Tax=Chrysophaeum taylorii TaxID=2483200 RepID=A0AAD7XLS1_9STRA|nr:hypothetical protein CTAYLR_001585 [Chrysophaeum taylorii]
MLLLVGSLVLQLQRRPLPLLGAVSSSSSSSSSSGELLVGGNAAYLRGALDEALELYAECVKVGEFPQACDCAVNLASVVLDRHGDVEGAEMLYRGALEAAAHGKWPAPRPGEPSKKEERGFFHVDAAHNLASLLQSRAAEATTTEARRVLLREAAALYRDVVRADEARWDAWANLGAAMLDANAPKLDAAKCLQHAILAAERVEKEYEANRDGRLGSVRHAIAKAYYGIGEALGHLTPEERDRAARDDDLILLDTNHSAQVVEEAAANALRTAVELASGDETLKAKAEHALAAVSRDLDKTRASPAFVRALFDDFASTFDEQLVGDLAYKVPELLAAKARARRRYDLALDAGCGTGLLGLSGLAVSTLYGADISAKMCEAARRRVRSDGAKVYDAVLEGDLLDPQLYLALGDRPDLVAAADVLCYFGDLKPLLSMWATALLPGGDIIFTVESLDDDDDDDAGPWRLAASGRYAHSRAHVDATAASLGLLLVDADPVVARLERGQPVNATLYVLHKPSI